VIYFSSPFPPFSNGRTCKFTLIGVQLPQLDNYCWWFCVNFIKEDGEWTYNILLNPQYQLSTTYLRFIFCVFQYIMKHLNCYVLLAVTRLLKLPFNSLFPEYRQQRWLWQLLTKFFMDWMIQIREISDSLKLICKINQSHEREFTLIATKLIVLLFFWLVQNEIFGTKIKCLVYPAKDQNLNGCPLI